MKDDLWMAALAVALAIFPLMSSASPSVRLRVAGVPEDETPAFTQGAVVEVVVSNASGSAISGEATLCVERWDGRFMETSLPNPGRDAPTARPQTFWFPGEVRRFSLPTADLAPDGYILTVESDGKALSVPLKFGIFAPYGPRDLYGVGNGMVCEFGLGRRHCGVTNAIEARDLAPVAIGKGDAFEAAIVGAPQSVECGVGYPSKSGVPFVNTPDGRSLHPYSPAGRDELLRSARVFGERAARNPQWATAKLRNEMFYLGRGAFVPDAWADADFRLFLKQRYVGDLARLNSAWGTDFTHWEEPAQPISASGGTGQFAKIGGEALDWMASMGKFTPESKEAVRRNPAQSMDWFRWRAASVNKVYSDYIAQAKKAAPSANVLYGNNYPWPNYFAHIVWPQWRTHDVLLLDLQYVCGFPKTLGNNEEMIDILEAAESIGNRFDKPIWGREVYYQPRYPGEVAALQNWAMVAHGMDVALDFAWKPYADWDREIFKSGPKSWENPNLRPCGLCRSSSDFQRTSTSRFPRFYRGSRTSDAGNPVPPTGYTSLPIAMPGSPPSVA